MPRSFVKKLVFVNRSLHLRFHEIFADPMRFRSITFLKEFVCACEVKIWAVEPSFSRKNY